MPYFAAYNGSTKSIIIEVNFNVTRKIQGNKINTSFYSYLNKVPALVLLT